MDVHKKQSTRRSGKKTYDDDYWTIPSDFSQLDHIVASYLSINEAIVLRTVYSMCRFKKQQYGTEWFQGSQTFWQSKLKFMSGRTLRRTFDVLIEKGLLEVREDHAKGNHYRPAKKQIEQMLKDAAAKQYDEINFEEQLQEDEVSESCQNGQTENDHLGQNGQTPCPNWPNHLGQNGQTLLTLGSPIHPSSVPNIPTASAVEVFEGQKSVDKVHKASKEQTGGSLIFEAYALAYSNKYGFQPTRGKEANRWAKKIYEEVGIDEGCSLVQHYVQMNKAWFIQKGHSLEWCFRDLTEVRRSFHTGITMTSSQIKHIENRQTAKETADEVQQSNGELASAWARIDTKRELKI